MPPSFPFRSVCVFCGSSSGHDAVYKNAAAALGETLARYGLRLVYGGGHVGLMGALADGALQAGGSVIGVIPQQLIDREIGHKGLSEMRVVQTMHERKALMAELAEAFIALPGGYGTLDEFCEILTWAQLSIHQKPCGILNVNGYYDPLLRLFDHAVQEGFLRAAHRDMIVVEATAERLLDRLRTARMDNIAKWAMPKATNAVP
jgi:uncharacterized protein (TIGR00730 family)